MIEIKCKAENFKLVPIEQIVPNPKNNNRHSIEQINAIAKLIKAHGFREPLTISNRSGFLNCGHARLEAATNLGMKEVPVIYQDFASEAEEYQHMTADNEIARWAELDYQNVYLSLEEIEGIDTELLGIENFYIEENKPIETTATANGPSALEKLEKYLNKEFLEIKLEYNQSDYDEVINNFADYMDKNSILTLSHAAQDILSKWKKSL